MPRPAADIPNVSDESNRVTTRSRQAGRRSRSYLAVSRWRVSVFQRLSVTVD